MNELEVPFGGQMLTFLEGRKEKEKEKEKGKIGHRVELAKLKSGLT